LPATERGGKTLPGGLEYKEIQELLLHRYPVLLVDRILEIEEEKGIVGLKNFTVNEPYFPGHFPGNPIVPGTILIESMAQVGAIFVARSRPATRGRLPYLVGLDHVRFRRPVVPGDQVIHYVEFLRSKKDLWKVKGVAKVNDEVVMEAILLAVLLPPLPKEEV
jgi:3-hydroxyacyl-[acyl-carrier-protein] dehydratase